MTAPTPAEALSHLDRTCAYAIQTLPACAQEPMRQSVLAALAVLIPICDAASQPKPATSTPQSDKAA